MLGVLRVFFDSVAHGDHSLDFRCILVKIETKTMIASFQGEEFSHTAGPKQQKNGKR